MVEVIVDHQVVVFDVVAHFADCFAHASFDDLAAVLATVSQTMAQGFLGRRQNEDGFALRHQLAHLLRALPVDFQNQVEAFGQRLLDPFLRSTVKVIEYLGMFEELAAFEHGVELCMVDEVVVHPIHFARAHGAGGVRDRNANLRFAVDQRLDQAGLAGAGGGGNDVEGAGGRGHENDPGKTWDER